MLLGAALSGLGIVATFMQRDEIRAQLADADAAMTADQLDAAVTAAIALRVAISVLIIAMWIWMAWANHRGLPWARTVATALGALGAAFTAVSFMIGELTPPEVVAGTATVVLAATIVVLLHRPDAGRHYTATAESVGGPPVRPGRPS
ncbi:MAG TPA: hypothetical protein VFZ68_06200 [Acidimicrobiales bacterium]